MILLKLESVVVSLRRANSISTLGAPASSKAMLTPRASAVAVLSLSAMACAENAMKPHPHQGILPKYDRVHPTKIGVSLKDVSNADLRKGEPVLRFVEVTKGFSRAISCQDVCAPESVIWSAINDLKNYPKMVEGVVGCDVYSDSKVGSTQVTCAKYKITAAGFGISYFMKHIYEPKAHCMTFHLDYDRQSDLSDTVGYWYVEDLKDGWCRVYYSTDSRLPSMIPAFAKNAMMNLAAKRSTGWVLKRCNVITGKAPVPSSTKGSGLRMPSPKLTLLLLLALVRKVELRGPAELLDLPQLLLQRLKGAAALS